MDQRELEYLRSIEDHASRTGWVAPSLTRIKTTWPISASCANATTSRCRKQREWNSTLSHGWQKASSISSRQTLELREAPHFRGASCCLYGYPMIQKGPPAAALLLASFKMMDRSHAF